jgi:polar amino acid transport system substrate-binding protein
MRNPRRLLAPVVLAGLFALSGCGGSSDSSSSSPSAPEVSQSDEAATTADAGALRFCTDPTYPPAEFKEGSDLNGFDIDIARAISDEMGAEATFTETGFDGIVAALEAGKCDALIAAMTITPEREEAISFVPYAADGFALMVQAGNPEGFEAFTDLSGHSVAVQVGSVQKDFAEEQSEKLETEGESGIEVITFPKDTDAAAALQSGRVDAYFADDAVTAYYVKQNGGLFELTARGINKAPIGIGVRKDDADTEKAITEAVDTLYADGTMDSIFKKWDIESFSIEGDK